MLHRGLLKTLSRAKDRLGLATDSSPSIREIADELGISLFHFTRLFKAVFGETPNQYQMRMKLERAKQLLAASDHTVTEVCMEVGYSSLGSFSDLFTRRVGMTPSSYRQKFRGLKASGELTRQLAPGCFSLMCSKPARG